MFSRDVVPKKFKRSNFLEPLDLDTGLISDLVSRLKINHFDECIINRPLDLVALFIYGDGKRLSLKEESSKKHYYLIFIFHEKSFSVNSVSKYIYGFIDIKNSKILSFNSTEYNELKLKLPCLQILMDEDKSIIDKKIMAVIDNLDNFEVCKEKAEEYANIEEDYKREFKKKSEYSLILCDLWRLGYPNDMVRKWYKDYLDSLINEESPKMVEIIEWFRDKI